MRSAIATLLLGAGFGSTVYGQNSLPVYQVTKIGASKSEAQALLAHFNLRGSRSAEGEVAFLDGAKFLNLPFVPGPRNDDTDKLLKETNNKNPDIPIQLEAIDTSALAKWRTLNEDVAMKTAISGFESAGLAPQFGNPEIGHNYITLVKGSDTDQGDPTDTAIDTSIIYTFTEPGGHRLIGPGAQAQITFDARGNVSRLLYSAYRLKKSDSVQIISSDEADRRISLISPQGAQITKSIVYFCPALSPFLPGADRAKQLTILPWYAYTTTTPVSDPTTGAVSYLTSRVRLLPATDDSRFIPSAVVKASSDGPHVRARVTVTGGSGPYTVIWGTGGSSVVESGRGWRVNVRGESDLRYLARRRWSDTFSRDEDFSLDRLETVSASVIDANGVEVEASQDVRVRAEPLGVYNDPLNELFAGLHAAGGPSGPPLFGCYNPADPGKWTPCRVGWQNSMLTSGAGAGVQEFAWTGDDAWPGDFVEPDPNGSLVSKPWIQGDADYSNWGINTADLVLHIGDGNADGFTQMQPGAPLKDYATSSVGAPIYQPAITLNENGFGTTKHYTVDYSNSWGPKGPNDTLEWLLMDDCDTHDFKDGNGENIAQRWGPAFNGLHVWAGFATTENGYGAFEQRVGSNILGLHGDPQTIVQSWFNSAFTNGTGDPAAMGPVVTIAIFTFTDIRDYYWGKGGVGPTMAPSDWPKKLFGWWYMHGHNPAKFVP